MIPIGELTTYVAFTVKQTLIATKMDRECNFGEISWMAEMGAAQGDQIFSQNFKLRAKNCQIWVEKSQVSSQNCQFFLAKMAKFGVKIV